MVEALRMMYWRPLEDCDGNVRLALYSRVVECEDHHFKFPYKHKHFLWQ